MKNKSQSSWETSSQWYDKIVGEAGHYYHQKIILPGLDKLLSTSDFSSIALLDVGCGQGVLASHYPNLKEYLGIDSSASLIKAAKKSHPQKNYQFLVADATAPLPVKKEHFTHAILMLSLQNMANPEAVIRSISSSLQKGGQLIIILNHPCFRIPKHSSWDIDQKNNMQSRKLNSYMSPEDPDPNSSGKEQFTDNMVLSQSPLNLLYPSPSIRVRR